MTKHKGKHSCHSKENKQGSESYCQTNKDTIGSERHYSNLGSTQTAYHHPEAEHYERRTPDARRSSEKYRQSAGYGNQEYQNSQYNQVHERGHPSSCDCSTHGEYMRQGERENQYMRGYHPREEMDERGEYYGMSGGGCCNESQDMRRHEMQYHTHPDSPRARASKEGCCEYDQSCCDSDRDYGTQRDYYGQGERECTHPRNRKETREEYEHRLACEDDYRRHCESYHRGSEFEGQFKSKDSSCCTNPNSQRPRTGRR